MEKLQHFYSTYTSTSNPLVVDEILDGEKIGDSEIERFQHQGFVSALRGRGNMFLLHPTGSSSNIKILSRSGDEWVVKIYPNNIPLSFDKKTYDNPDDSSYIVFVTNEYENKLYLIKLDLSNGELSKRQLNTDPNFQNAVRVSRDGSMIIVGDQLSATVYDQDLNLIFIFKNLDFYELADISPDNKTLIMYMLGNSNGNDSLRLFNIETERSNLYEINMSKSETFYDSLLKLEICQNSVIRITFSYVDKNFDSYTINFDISRGRFDLIRKDQVILGPESSHDIFILDDMGYISEFNIIHRDILGEYNIFKNTWLLYKDQKIPRDIVIAIVKKQTTFTDTELYKLFQLLEDQERKSIKRPDNKEELYQNLKMILEYY